MEASGYFNYESRKIRRRSSGQEWFVQNADQIEEWYEYFEEISGFDAEFLNDFKNELNLGVLFSWAIHNEKIHLINTLSTIMDINYVRYWLRKKPLNTITPSLCAAAYHGLKNSLDMLIQCGADPNSKGISTGKSPLMISLEQSHIEDNIHRYLIEAGANINDKCHKGWTPLDYLYNNELNYLYDNANPYTIVKEYLLNLGAVPGAGASESKDQDYNKWEWVG